MYDLPTNVTRAKIEQVIRNKLAINLGEYYQMHHLRLQLKYDPIINDTDGYLSRAKVQFESDAVFKLACEGMKYFELCPGSGHWSYGVPSKIPKTSEYAEISDQIVYVANVPIGVTSKHLDSIFKGFGQIVFCRLQIDN